MRVLLLPELSKTGLITGSDQTVRAVYSWFKILFSINVFFHLGTLGRIAQSLVRLVKIRGPGFDTRFGHLLSFLLPLIQGGKLSITGESMCTHCWLTV